MYRGELSDDIENQPEERKSTLPEFFRKKGGFSLNASSNSLVSEIPGNTIDIHPRDALFKNQKRCHCDCVCYTCARKNKIYRIVAGLTCIFLIGLLVCSITYHTIRTNKDDEESSANKYRFSVHIHLLNNTSEDTFGEELDELSIPTENSIYDEHPKIDLIENIEDSYDDDFFWPRIQSRLAYNRLLFQATKRRLRRNIEASYSNKQFQKNCIGEDCDLLVGSTHEKYSEILKHLKDIKEMLLKYEKRLLENPKTAFHSFSLTYPTESNFRDVVGAVVNTLSNIYKNQSEEGKEKIVENFTHATTIETKTTPPTITSSSNYDSREINSTESLIEEPPTDNPHRIYIISDKPTTDSSESRSYEISSTDPIEISENDSSTLQQGSNDETEKSDDLSKSITPESVESSEEQTVRESSEEHTTLSIVDDEHTEMQLSSTQGSIVGDEHTETQISSTQESIVGDEHTEIQLSSTLESVVRDEQSEMQLPSLKESAERDTSTEEQYESVDQTTVVQQQLSIEATSEKPMNILPMESKDLDEELLKEAPKKTMPAMSLQELKHHQMQDKKDMWYSRVVTNPDQVSMPTGPDAVVGVGEAIKTSHQLTISPSGSFPYFICFYNAHSKDYPSIRSMERTYNLNPNLLYNPPTSSPPHTPLKITQPAGQANVINFFMNQPYEKETSHFSTPHQQEPLYCTHLQPPVFQFPTVPGSMEYTQARCENCNAYSSSTNSFSEPKHYEPNVCSQSGQVSCKDGSLCIPVEHWCDNIVHCHDASDELYCSCKDRIDKSKHCDSILDCPRGEDEQNCFDCPSSKFACGERDERKQCIDYSNRCDGNPDCPLGRDEEGCSLLSSDNSSVPLHVPYTEGFLYHNMHGVWYPVCDDVTNLQWANQACLSESNDQDVTESEVSSKHAPSHMKGPFVTINTEESIKIVEHCKGHRVIYVKCPPLRCGARYPTGEESLGVTDFVARLKRFIESDGPKKKPETLQEEALLVYLENMEKEVKKKFNVEEIMVKIETYPGRGRGKRQDGRVVGGKESDLMSWPWAAALYKNGKFHCGAVLLDDLWVLTAAHCVSKFWENYYEVRLGMLRRFSFSPMEQIRKIVMVISHETYDQQSMKNDIAVLKMNTPVGFNRWVRPPCLPANADWAHSYWGPTPGSMCVAIGWGAVKEHGRDPDQLREVEVPILNRCKHIDDIDGGEICAGYIRGGKDTCQGDSGGPLMCRDEPNANAWYVAGIVSHGEGCARPNEPGAYTRVSLYIDWITSATSQMIEPTLKPILNCPGFLCPSHPGRCLPKKWRCNGVVDCLRGEDESNCPQLRSEEGESEKNDALEKLQLRLQATQLDNFNYSVSKQPSKTFSCAMIPQNISGLSRCDGIDDCLDGTDELNCTCAMKLLLSNADSICDGIQDCDDLTDELECFTCPNNYFNCRMSKQCVSLSKKCDNVVDCEHEEDERDCLAVTFNQTLVIDQTGRPVFDYQGMVVANTRGTWSLLCQSKIIDKKRTADAVCRYLGWTGSNYYQDGLSNVILLVNDQSNLFLGLNEVKIDKNCSGFEVVCSKTTGTVEKRTKPTQRKWYWGAEIFSDGTYACSGILLTTNWVMVSTSCIDRKSYITVQLGRFTTFSPTFYNIHSINMQNETSFLQIDHYVKITRNIRPIQLPLHGTNQLTSCMAVWRNKSVKLRVDDSDCIPGHVCYKRTRRPHRGCSSVPWVGVVVCNSDSGWTPTAVFNEPGGECGFQHSIFPNISNIFVNDSNILELQYENIQFNKCGDKDQFKCSSGLCLSSKEVCNGIAECPGREDEEEKYCSGHRTCSLWEWKCDYSECINSTQVMDGTPDCMNGEDERPHKELQCLRFLERSHDHQICDGFRNCLDKSDETQCRCEARHFRCDGDKTCFPKEFVCDKENDCTDGSDEKGCQKLVHSFRREYELKEMSYGLWHTKCNVNLTLIEADDMCQKVGRKKAQKVEQRTEPNPLRITINNATEINLNSALTMYIRSSKPFASMYKADQPCFVTYVTCY